MPIVAMPDGTNVSFPDEMPAEQIRSMIAQRFPNETGGMAAAAAPMQQQAAPVQDPNIVKGSLLPFSRNKATGETSFDSSAGIIGSIKNALSLPGEVAAGKFATTPEVPGMISETDLAREQANQQALTGRTLELATVASPMSAGARVVGPAAEAAGLTHAQRVASATKEAGVNGPKPALKEIEALKSEATAAYKVVDDAGVVVSPQSFKPVVQDIARTAIKEGLDPTLHPEATAALKRLGDVMNEPLTLSTIDTLRQVIKDAATGKSARLAEIMKDKLDDFVSGIGMKDVIATSENPEVATKALLEARKLWHAAKKSEAVENLVERATTRAGQFSGSGFENALRTEFRQFVMNKKNLRGWSKEEIDAAKKVARGGTVDNIARMVGKFAPTGVVSTVMSGGAGAAVGGGIGAVALPAVGFAARQYATHRTKGNVDTVRALVRGGEKRESGSATVNTKELLKNLLARSTILGGPQSILTPRR
jgi:hypothetical protein